MSAPTVCPLCGEPVIGLDELLWNRRKIMRYPCPTCGDVMIAEDALDEDLEDMRDAEDRESLARLSAWVRGRTDRGEKPAVLTATPQKSGEYLCVTVKEALEAV